MEIVFHFVRVQLLTEIYTQCCIQSPSESPSELAYWNSEIHSEYLVCCTGFLHVFTLNDLYLAVLSCTQNTYNKTCLSSFSSLFRKCPATFVLLCMSVCFILHYFKYTLLKKIVYKQVTLSEFSISSIVVFFCLQIIKF